MDNYLTLVLCTSINEKALLPELALKAMFKRPAKSSNRRDLSDMDPADNMACLPSQMCRGFSNFLTIRIEMCSNTHPV